MNIPSENLLGLILAGGHSTRMGQDKSLLAYHGKSQLDYSFELLKGFCSRVFVSTRSEQSKQSGYSHLPQLHDLPQYSGIGPLGGILSAMTKFPDTSILVLACDLPFVSNETIADLISQRDLSKAATAFISSTDGLPEPLCAIWEKSEKSELIRLLDDGIKCPRKCLIKSDIHLIHPKDPHWLDNINNPGEYTQVQRLLKDA